MRIFLTRAFARFARRAGIGDPTLIEAIRRADEGLIEAVLGSGLIKQRIGRSGQGRSGGYRTIIAYKAEARAFFLYGFAKNEKGNIDRLELATLKDLAGVLLRSSNKDLDDLIRNGGLMEMENA